MHSAYHLAEFGAEFAKTDKQRFPASAPDLSVAKDVTLPNLGNIWEMVFFSPGCAKSNRKKNHWDKSYKMRKSWRKEDINRILEENLFFCFIFSACGYWFLKLFHISRQQKPWTLQALPPFTYASPSFLTYWSDVPSLIKTWPLAAECMVRAARTVTGLHEGLGMWSS